MFVHIGMYTGVLSADVPVEVRTSVRTNRVHASGPRNGLLSLCVSNFEHVRSSWKSHTSENLRDKVLTPKVPVKNDQVKNPLHLC